MIKLTMTVAVNRMPPFQTLGQFNGNFVAKLGRLLLRTDGNYITDDGNVTDSFSGDELEFIGSVGQDEVHLTRVVVKNRLIRCIIGLEFS